MTPVVDSKRDKFQNYNVWYDSQAVAGQETLFYINKIQESVIY